MLDIPIRPRTRLDNKSMKLLPKMGHSQTGAGLEHERVGKFIGPGSELDWVLEVGEEEVDGLDGFGAPGIGPDHGVEVVRVWSREGFKNEAGIGEVSRGRESREGKEGGESLLVSGLGARTRLEYVGVELHGLGHGGDLHCWTSLVCSLDKKEDVSLSRVVSALQFANDNWQWQGSYEDEVSYLIFVS